jgi:sulfur transfer protein SufE
MEYSSLSQCTANVWLLTTQRNKQNLTYFQWKVVRTAEASNMYLSIAIIFLDIARISVRRYRNYSMLA